MAGSPQSPQARFAGQLAELHKAAGKPSLRRLEAYNRTSAPLEHRGRLSRASLGAWLAGDFVQPLPLDGVFAFVAACLALDGDASGQPSPQLAALASPVVWRRRHGALTEELDALASARGDAAPEPTPSLLDPPYRPLPAGAPDVWLLQPRFAVVPYVGRDGLLGDLEEWCAGDGAFAVGFVAGEGGSGKSRLAAELCARMRDRGWDAGPVTRAEALTGSDPASATLLVVDYPERWLTVLGPALERLATRTAGPAIRVLLLARRPIARSHWWAELDRASHRTASLFTTLRRDLTEHALTPAERRVHAAAAMLAFGRHLGVEPGEPLERVEPLELAELPEPPDVMDVTDLVDLPATAGVTDPAELPDMTDDQFANPLMVHVAALLAVHGRRGAPDPERPVREDVLGHLLAREQERWIRLCPAHRLDDLHEIHALRAVLVAALTGPGAGEAAELLAALPEFAGPAQRERRGRLAYWLAELYPGERLLASFGPDLLVEELLDTAARGDAGLEEVVAAVHGHDVTRAEHRARLLTALRLAAERRPAVFAALHAHLVEHLPALVRQALEEPDGVLANALDSALVLCGEREDPGLRLAFACAGIQPFVPQYHQRGAQLLCTTMERALRLFRGLAAIDPDEYPDVLPAGLDQLTHRYFEAGRDEEGLALQLECVQVRRQLARKDPEGRLAPLAFDLSNLSVAYMRLNRDGEALAAAEEAVALERRLSAGSGQERVELAITLHRLSAVQGERDSYGEAFENNSEALRILRRAAERGDPAYASLQAAVLGYQGALLATQDRNEEALAAVTQAIELHERRTGERPDEYLPSLQYHLHHLSRATVSLQRYDDALASAERAVAASRRLTASNPRRHRDVLIRNLRQLAEVRLRLELPQDAVAAGEEAVAVGRQGTDADLALALRQLAELLTELDRPAEALPVWEEAEAVARRLAESDPHRGVPLASVLGRLSRVLHRLGRGEDAVTAAREAVALARRAGEDGRWELARALIWLGDLHTALGSFPQALEHFQEGTALRRAAAARADLVPALTRLAEAHARLGQDDEALAAAVEAVQAGEAAQSVDTRGAGTHPADGHPVGTPPDRRADLAQALSTLAEIHSYGDRHGDAIAPLTRAVRLYEDLALDPAGHYRHALAAHLHQLALAQSATGRHDEAALNCLRGAGLYERLAAADERHLPQLSGSLRHLRDALVTAGHLDEAVSAARREVDTVRRLIGGGPEVRDHLVEAYDGLVRLLVLTGRPAEARRMEVLADLHHTVALREGRGDP